MDSFADAVGRARESWGAFGLSDASLVQMLRERLSKESQPESILGSLHTADLCLALACANGDPKALTLFEEQFLADVASAVARVQHCNADDLRGVLRERLLVQRGELPPRIAEYNGKGSLRAWLQVTASRTATTQARRKSETPIEDAVLLTEAHQSTDPILGGLKEKYRAEFAQAFAEAFQSIATRDRNLLRQHFLDGLSGQELASLYRVHRATAVRWLAAARQALFLATRANLARRMDIPEREFQSVLRLVRSELQVGLSSLRKE